MINASSTGALSGALHFAGPKTGRALSDSFGDWPSVAVNFAIYSHRKILAEGRALGVEAAQMAIRRTRAWWSVSTLDDDASRKRWKQPDIEPALMALAVYRTRLERAEHGMRLVVGVFNVGRDLEDALRILGIDHLERIVRAEGRTA